MDKKDVVYMYNGILLGHKKKNKIIPFAATWMDPEIIILSEVRQRQTNIIWYRLYVESKKNDTNELIYKTAIDLQIQKTNYGYKRGKVEGGNKLGVWD